MRIKQGTRYTFEKYKLTHFSIKVIKIKLLLKEKVVLINTIFFPNYNNNIV